MTQRPNRPHYHVWLMAATDRIFYRAYAAHTRQAAAQWAARRQSDPDRRMVLRCWHAKCAPTL